MDNESGETTEEDDVRECREEERQKQKQRDCDEDDGRKRRPASRDEVIDQVSVVRMP